MSSEEFWEQSPQLYWSYRTFYLKKLDADMEQIKYKSWLEGKINTIATSIAISNCFGDNDKTQEYPSFNDMFDEETFVVLFEMLPK